MVPTSVRKKVFISFDMDLTYFLAMSFDILLSREVGVSMVICFIRSIYLMKV